MARTENIESDHTKVIVCPWCGYNDPESWETAWDLAQGREGKYVNDNCKKCGKEFAFTIHHKIYYTTKKN